eukprot:13580106-Ditylum_brightwellii.AAC.1
MLDEALPCWLLAEIEERETGLNTVSIQDILDQTFDHRGQIDDDLVDKYNTIYNSPIDVSKGFNAYVERQEECHDFFKMQSNPSQIPNSLQKVNSMLDKLASSKKRVGANATVEQAQSNMSELKEAMDNLVYTATTSNNILGQLTDTNSKFT